MAKNQYFIMRTEKRKAQDLYGIEAEANREVGEDNNKKFANSDIDNAKTKDNFYFIEGHNWKKIIEKTAEQYGLKPRKNSTLLIDTLYNASPEFFADKTEEQIREYYHDCLQFHIQEYCAGNPNLVINARVHLDEATPHMTLQSLPIYVDNNGKAHYSAKDILGGRKALSQHQDHFYEQVGKKWGLARGKTLDGEKKKKHLTVQEYKTQENEKKLQEQEIKIQENEKKLQEQENQVDELQRQADEAIEKRDRAKTELAGIEAYKHEEAERSKNRYHDMELNLDRMVPTLEVKTKSLPEDSHLREEAERKGQKKIQAHIISDADLQLILGAQKNIYLDKQEEDKRFKDWDNKVYYRVRHFEEENFWKTDSGQFKNQTIKMANSNAKKRFGKKYDERVKALDKREDEIRRKEVQLAKVPALEKENKKLKKDNVDFGRVLKFAVSFCKKHFNIDIKEEWEKHQHRLAEAQRAQQSQYAQRGESKFPPSKGLKH